MRLTLEQRQEREREVVAKAERSYERVKSRFRKAVKGATISHEDGWFCFMFPNGQVFRCRGTLVFDTFGSLLKEYEERGR